MTLDKAIEIYEKGAKLTWNGKPTVEAEECQQLAEWLKELQAHREAWMKMQEEIDKLNPDDNSYSVKNNACLIVSKYRPKEGDNE